MNCHRQHCGKLSARKQRNRSGFTLIELLVVTAILALLVQIIVPSLRRSFLHAQSTVCQANLRDMYVSVRIYADDNEGWLPGADQSARYEGWAWPSALYESNPGGLGALICPSDPWAPELRAQISSPSFDFASNVSYGLNDFVISGPADMLANLDRSRPRRPADTILAGDLGPDQYSSGTSAGQITVGPSRTSGRMLVDDGYVPGQPVVDRGRPWLTARHQNSINVLTWAGGIKKVDVVGPMSAPLEAYYSNGASQGCTLCLDFETPHYSFAASQAFWWTGPLPTR